MVEKLQTYYKNELAGKHFAIWGLSFKPNTDDIREAPSLHIINGLLALGATVCCYDPEAMDHIKKIFGNSIQYAENPYDALTDADALLILTEWNLFRTPDFQKLSNHLKSKTIFDGRNIYSMEQMNELGFYYESVGRKTIKQ
jgi:UDPglucose 6-dehydrogenase